MIELWSTLIPLGIVAALMPVELALTLLMVRAPGGNARTAAWIGGMTVVRLAQYGLLYLVLAPATDDGQPGTSLVEGALLLMIAVLLLVSAARKATSQPDEDAPPPRWMAMAAGLTPARAFLLGAGLVALSPKKWAFTIGATGAIGDASLGGASGWIVFLAFILIAQSLHLAALGIAVASPATAAGVLGRAGDALERHSRPVMIAASAIFGAWFLVKALGAFGLL